MGGSLKLDTSVNEQTRGVRDWQSEREMNHVMISEKPLGIFDAALWFWGQPGLGSEVWEQPATNTKSLSAEDGNRDETDEPAAQRCSATQATLLKYALYYMYIKVMGYLCSSLIHMPTTQDQHEENRGYQCRSEDSWGTNPSVMSL